MSGPGPQVSSVLLVAGRPVIVAEASFAELLERVRGPLASAEVPVLVEGETGVGKELVARALHEASPRAAGPFVVVTASGSSAAQVEAELFGDSARGARSLVESAAGGTLFLEELAELSLSAQAKLLRVLEQETVRPVGAVEERPVAVRVVAATQKRLAEEVEAGRFRRELYYRLRAGIVHIPPLRARPADLEALARHALARTAGGLGRVPPTLDEGARRALLTHRWPGNVRELFAWAESTVMASPRELITQAEVDAWTSPARGRSTLYSLPPVSIAPPRRSLSPGGRGGAPRFRPLAEEVAELERLRMRQALQASKGNRTRAASLIGMPLRTFATKLKQYGLEREGIELPKTG
jgi:DNA-binding NtrC family response regulator